MDLIRIKAFYGLDPDQGLFMDRIRINAFLLTASGSRSFYGPDPDPTSQKVHIRLNICFFFKIKLHSFVPA